jgi:formyltetrahydrofolate deformylase
VHVYVMTLRCDDRAGIVHAASGAIVTLAGNILENDQFTDAPTGQFCMRTRFESPSDPASARARLESDLAEFAPVLGLRLEHERRRALVMVSTFDHCLADLLYRREQGDLPLDIVAVVSNHPDLAPLAERYGVAFHHVPVTPATKDEAERHLRNLLSAYAVDFVVLARYMQILSPALCEELSGRIINIHHSFLPGFRGARPYHQAYERGVKLIGATAHFVTSDLDEGPIIEQDVVRVSHAHRPLDMVSLGRDIERTVLARAVRLVAEDRVTIVGQRTVIFSR